MEPPPKVHLSVAGHRQTLRNQLRLVRLGELSNFFCHDHEARQTLVDKEKRLANRTFKAFRNTLPKENCFRRRKRTVCGEFKGLYVSTKIDKFRRGIDEQN